MDDYISCTRTLSLHNRKRRRKPGHGQPSKADDLILVLDDRSSQWAAEIHTGWANRVPSRRRVGSMRRTGVGG